MKIHDVEQGSDEWLALRLGLPTASFFKEIMTDGCKLSKSAKACAARLVAEIVLEMPLQKDLGNIPAVQWGRAMEPVAVLAYEFEFDVKTEKIGFVTDDEGRYGASPDRLVGEDGLLEIKCPEAPKHVLYMTGGFGKEYFSQVQGQLLVTGRKWCDLVSWSVDFPLYCERMERDEAYLASLAKCLAEFHETKIRMLNQVNSYSASLVPHEQENA